MRYCLRFIFAVVALMALTVCVRADFRLGAGDELRIVVADQPQISGVFAVAEDGTIFMLMGGRITVGGLTIEGASNAVTASLSKYIVDPAIAMEVSKYRPYFVLGDVATPGMYATTPGMTPLKAVAIAGGLRGRGDSLESAVTSIRAEESFAVALKQRLDATVLEARLKAELDDADTFDWSSDRLSDVERGLLGKIVGFERELFIVNSVNFAKQRKIFEDLIALRKAEIAVLQKRFEAQEKQTASLRDEIDRIEKLLKSGVSTIPQRNALNREETRSISEGLQIRLSQNQAEQGLRQSELGLTTLLRDRRATLLEQSAAVSQLLQKLGEEISAAEALMLETGSSPRDINGKRSMTFSVRGNNGTGPDVAVDQTYPVQPGDIVTIRRNMDSARAPVAN